MARLGFSFLLLVALVSALSGCASDAKRRSDQDMIVVEKKSDRQVIAEFDGKYASAFDAGKFDLGNEPHVLQYGGKTYYFGSADAKSRFEQGLDDNQQHAGDNWQNAVVGSRQPS